MAVAIPVYLETGLDDVYGLFHLAASGVSTGAAVLICAPWGWDETASYRSRRDWAERLASAGHPTLRFDLPATGDSAGLPSDPARVEAWIAAVAAAAEWLRDSAACERTVALGLGLGGLLARAAVERGAPIDELVLWAAPTQGRAFAREVRAFSRLQTWGTDADGGSSLPDGWTEAGGFVLSAETNEALRSLDPGDPPSSLRRVLLLDRDGIEVDPALHERFDRAGAEVAVAPGPGWQEMISHPEKTKPPLETIDKVAAWLAEGDANEGGGATAPAPGSRQLTIDDRQVRETPIEINQPFGRAFGVLSEPVAEPVGRLCAVFLNAGAVRHIGPNRIWVEAARRWAARGVPSLRLDLEGIGEADGDQSRLTEVSEFYVSSYEKQVGTALDDLQARGLGSRFILVGLCAGGYWSFRAALCDPRVKAAVLLNAGALSWRSELISEREVRKVTRALSWRWWSKLLQGEVSLAKLVALGRSMLWKSRQIAKRLFASGAGPDLESFDANFALLQSRGTRLAMAFSAEEPLGTELDAAGISGRIDSWSTIDLGSLPGDDHTLRPTSAQAGAHRLIDSEIAREIARSSDAAPQPGAAGRQR